MDVVYRSPGSYARKMRRTRTMSDQAYRNKGQRPLVYARKPNRDAALVAKANRMKGSDTGYVDLATAIYPLDLTGSITLIPTIAQGATVNQRVGKKAIFKSLQCRGQAFNGTTATFNDCCFLIVYDRRPTGALPAITDILVSANAAALNNDVNSGRFKILKRVDWMMIGPITGVIATQQLTDCSAQSMDFYLKLRGLPTVFKALTTGAIDDIEEGAIYLVTVGSNVAGTTAASLNVRFRTRFLDV